jgi:HD superfamily phosphodiesterase
MELSPISKKMIDFYAGSLHDIEHFLKVWGYARTVGQLEELDGETLFTLELAALTHDIACPLCREKYGAALWDKQEEEGAPMVREFLADTHLSPALIDRVAYLVGHHHTLRGIDGADYQILIEADYMVNAAENGLEKAEITAFVEKYFRTESGTSLIKSIFSL